MPRKPNEWIGSMEKPEVRYREDATFRMLVDAVESMIHDAKYTPSELREAVTLAAIHYESTNINRRYFYDPSDPMAILHRDRT